MNPGIAMRGYKRAVDVTPSGADVPIDPPCDAVLFTSTLAGVGVVTPALGDNIALDIWANSHVLLPVSATAAVDSGTTADAIWALYYE